MATRNMQDFITGIVCTALGIIIIGAFTYAVFIEDYLFKSSAVTVRATIERLEEKKKEEQFRSEAGSAKATITEYFLHYAYKDEKNVEHKANWKVAKADFEHYSKPDIQKAGLKVFYQPAEPTSNRPDFERRRDGSFWWVVGVVFAISAVLLWVGIESFYYA